jgi:glycyl-tRNA synthetase alpha chain
MYLQQADNVYDLLWTDGITYGDIHHRSEVEFSRYNFEEGDVSMLMATFQAFEEECRRLLDRKLTLPAYDYCIKTSHMFNVLDARGAISVTERTAYIARVRALARRCAESYLADREALGHPLLKQTTGTATGDVTHSTVMRK